MKKRPFQLVPRHRRWLYGVASVLFLSGTFWWIADVVVDRAWPGSGFAGAAKSWLLKAHGAAAMASLFVLGTLWTNHVRRAWQAGQNRRSGAVLVAWMAVLVISGYGLYYIGDDGARTWTARIHDALGLAAVFVLGTHVWLGHRSAKRSGRTGSSPRH